MLRLVSGVLTTNFVFALQNVKTSFMYLPQVSYKYPLTFKLPMPKNPTNKILNHITDDNQIRDSFFAEIQLIIDREVETRLDNLIIFGDDDNPKPKVSALKRASIHATKVLAKAKALFPSSSSSNNYSKKSKKVPLKSTKSLEDEVDDLINLSAAKIGDNCVIEDNLIPPPPIANENNNDDSMMNNVNLAQRMNNFDIGDDGFLT